MNNDTSTHPLPIGMALIETAAGRWFPACAPLEDPPWLVQIVQGSGDIPPALGPRHDGGQGYPTRSKAIGACLAWQEAAVLPVHWDKVAAHTELFPERNAWYLDEIAHLTGDDTPLLFCGTNVSAVVMADQDDLDGTILAEGDSIDEAIEALYQRVYAWYCHKHTTQKRAS